MMKRVFSLLRRLGELCQNRQISRSSAALSYYLTMSLFPVIVCLYSLLGSNYEKMLQILDLADKLMNPETTRFLKSFLRYVASNSDPGLPTAALLLLLSSASAAARVMQTSLREIRGDTEKHRNLRGWLFSFLFSLAFLAALYFGILVMLTGQSFLEFVDRAMQVVSISRSWSWLRFPVLGGLVFLTLWGVYAASGVGHVKKRSTAPGALVGTLGIVVMSLVFSVFIAASSRYPLVYGSLDSIILLMFWLFLCGEMIFIGAAVNVLCSERKGRSGGERE